MDFRDAPVIARDEAVENLREPHPGAAVDSAHDSEVDGSNPPVLQSEQIPVVEVGMEKTVDHCLTKERADENGGKRLAIMARGDQCIAIVELDAVEPFEREDTPCGSPPVDFRNIITGLGDHVLAKLGRGRGLALQVELAGSPLLELCDHKPWPKSRCLIAHGLDVGGRPFVGLDRPGDVFLDAGPEHFHRNHASLGRYRLMHLRYRSCADRLLFEIRKTGFRSELRTMSRLSA